MQIDNGHDTIRVSMWSIPLFLDICVNMIYHVSIIIIIIINNFSNLGTLIWQILGFLI